MNQKDSHIFFWNRNCFSLQWLEPGTVSNREKSNHLKSHMVNLLKSKFCFKPNPVRCVVRHVTAGFLFNQNFYVVILTTSNRALYSSASNV